VGGAFGNDFRLGCMSKQRLVREMRRQQKKVGRSFCDPPLKPQPQQVLENLGGMEANEPSSD
jgi:hypothetical protein